MSDEMTNDELRRRLVQGMALCPEEHTAHTAEVGGDTRYWLTCGEETLAEVTLGKAEEPAGFFERWGRQHQYEVAREHLKRLLDPPPEHERPIIKPGGLLEDLLIICQTTNETLKRIEGIMDLQRDRMNIQEQRLDDLEQRLVTAEQRLQGNLAL